MINEQMTNDQMTKGRIVLVLVVLLGGLVLASGAVVGAQAPRPMAPAEAYIDVELSQHQMGVDELVWMTLWGANVADVQSWEATISVSCEVLSPTGQVAWGGILPGDSINLGPDFEDHTFVMGQIGDTQYSGNGRLVALEWQATGPGTCAFAVEEIHLWQGAGVEQEVYDIEGDVVSIVTCLGDFVEPWGFRDLADIMAMLPAWNSDVGDDNYDVKFDLYPIGDPDGHIGLGDIMVVVSVWNTPCP